MTPLLDWVEIIAISASAGVIWAIPISLIGALSSTMRRCHDDPLRPPTSLFFKVAYYIAMLAVWFVSSFLVVAGIGVLWLSGEHITLAILRWLR